MLLSLLCFFCRSKARLTGELFCEGCICEGKGILYEEKEKVCSVWGCGLPAVSPEIPYCDGHEATHRKWHLCSRSWCGRAVPEKEHRCSKHGGVDYELPSFFCPPSPAKSVAIGCNAVAHPTVATSLGSSVMLDHGGTILGVEAPEPPPKKCCEADGCEGEALLGSRCCVDPAHLPKENVCDRSSCEKPRWGDLPSCFDCTNDYMRSCRLRDVSWQEYCALKEGDE